MAQTYTQLFYHLVFSTKNREPLHPPRLATGPARLHRRDRPQPSRGTDRCRRHPNHIHLLVRLPADRAVADIVRDIKAISSGWRTRTATRGFWQGGDGAFTVSKSMIETVTRYIDRQEEHHRVQTFREEFIDLLRRHGVE